MRGRCGIAAAEEPAATGPNGRARFQPHRATADPGSCVRSRRHDADTDCTARERAGETRSEIAVAPPDATRPAAEIELPLASLSAGDYGIALSATNDGGDASEIVAFRVTP